MCVIHGQQVTIENGETLYIREREGGEVPVLLIHGNMTSSKHWDVVLEKMDASYKLYAIDLRGFGKSTYNQSFQSLKELADDVHAVVEKLGVQHASVVGWSTGGGVAMQLAAGYPKFVDRLILMSSLSTRGYPFQDHEGKRLNTKEQIENDGLRTIPTLQAYKNRDKSFLKKVWNAGIYTNHQPEPERYEEYLEDMLTQRNLVDIYYANNHFNMSNTYNGLEEGTKEIEHIQAPTLVVWGEDDLVIVRSMTEEIIEDFQTFNKDVHVSYLQDTGHSPPIDRLEELIETFERFIANE
ncbi:alpha/beta fold hydrolase [Geomicrobium sp. JSM 1781026]|uniref:intracellular short-chain-length polyhydroxyalkanoate depolymerase n=1 Tax=Geomicrobium sp. JSM 1781026 TaxID=3344580 RepID=UPI0035BF45F2